MSAVSLAEARYRLIARHMPVRRGGKIWQTKIPAATRLKSHRPQSKQRPRPSQKSRAHDGAPKQPVRRRERARRRALPPRDKLPNRASPRPPNPRNDGKTRAATPAPAPRPASLAKPGSGPNNTHPGTPVRITPNRDAKRGPGQPASGSQDDRRPAQQGGANESDSTYSQRVFDPTASDTVPGRGGRVVGSGSGSSGGDGWLGQ